MPLRFNLDINSAETGEEESKGWLDLGQVQDILLNAKEGDDVVVHCLGYQPASI